MLNHRDLIAMQYGLHVLDQRDYQSVFSDVSIDVLIGCKSLFLVRLTPKWSDLLIMSSPSQTECGEGPNIEKATDEAGSPTALPQL